MRSVVLTASLMTALWLGLPAAVSAQEPPPPPPPAPEAPPPPRAREYAVPRSERVQTRESQARTPETRSADDRGSQPAPSETRTPVRSPERARQAEADNGRRQPASASSATAGAAGDDQGAQRRGASRRPPADGGSTGGAQARDRAVPRTTARRPEPERVYVYPNRWNYNRYYYDPYYDDGFGFGLGYLYYSPWGWTPSFYGSPYGYGYGAGYQGGRYAARGYDIGTVKLKVDQRDAEVYVDGYFAGHIDDFDGFLQALKLDSGPYRIEVRKPGYETLHFDVRVQPDRNITFRGQMRPAP